jgi:hypothetical protein
MNPFSLPELEISSTDVRSISNTGHNTTAKIRMSMGPTQGSGPARIFFIGTSNLLQLY